MPSPEVVALPFDEAIGFFRQKINLPTRAWTDLWQGMHARAFVVAGAMKDELIADLRQSVEQAIAEGTTIETFRQQFDRTVAKHGWQYRGNRGWRTSVIFNTNLRTAYAAGKWNQIQRLAKRRPLLRYVAILDDRTRPQHVAWHGTVLEIDNSWWASHYPPNGWNCRCTVQQLSGRDLKRFGFEKSKRAPATRLVDKEIKTPAGPVNVQVPDGIDPGFNYNVGQAAFGRGRQQVALERHGAFTALEAPGAARRALPAVPLDQPKAPVGPLARNERGLRAALRKAIGGDEEIFADPLGGRVQVGQGLVDHMLASAARRDGREALFPFIRELVEDPAEIWLGFAESAASGRVLIRRRYVKLLEIDKRRALALVADADGGVWSGMTFFRGRPDALRRLRQGHSIYRRE